LFLRFICARSIDYTQTHSRYDKRPIRMTATIASPTHSATALDLRATRLRANPAYELIQFDRLSESELQPLRELAEDPDCYGVLRPRIASHLGLKAVSRDTALLLFSLRETGLLPGYAARSLGADCAAIIGKMVLDGILEIEADGAMISGPEACMLVYGTAIIPESEGQLAAISRRAVEYAAALELDDPPELSARLYSYNCIPASPRWREFLPKDETTAKYLGLVDGDAARVLSGGWRPIPESQAWISWRARIADSKEKRVAVPEITYKLYVSPTCGQLREAVHAIAKSVARSNAMQWKVGKGIQGLLRPDKMVVYFRHFADLQEVAFTIMGHLAGCPSHGVPFTAELAGEGLLSWGIDPPREAHAPSWLGAESWRGKLCNRLAMALVQAASEHGNESDRDADGTAKAARFAIQRLRLEGIDASTWTPVQGFVWAS
jgi:hypothetical protein